MIITTLTDFSSYGEFRALAPFVDLALATALLIIALLGQCGYLPMPNSVSDPLLGASGLYAGLVLLSGCVGTIKAIKALNK